VNTRAALAFAICTVVSACGDGAAQAPKPASAGELAAARQVVTAAGGHVSTGVAGSGVNAASPTHCNAPGTQFVEARVGTVTDDEGGTWAVPAAVHPGATGTDLFNDCTGRGLNASYTAQLDTVVIDPDGVEITALIHGDNYFELYVNGTFVCRDPIAFTPFNSTACRFRAKYPVTYALRAVDWEEHLGVGMEYGRYNVGDGGIVAHFSDGTTTDESWRAETFYLAPLDSATCLKIGALGARDSSACSVKPACATSARAATCQAVHFAEPADWAAPAFSDASWPLVTVYTRAQFGPKEAYTKLEKEFGDAKFVWSRNIKIDNLVLLRKTVAAH
jgi:hypothetical protein